MAHKLPWDLNAGMYVIGACIGIASGLWSVEKLPLYSPPILCILWFVAVCVPVGLFDFKTIFHIFGAAYGILHLRLRRIIFYSRNGVCLDRDFEARRDAFRD